MAPCFAVVSRVVFAFVARQQRTSAYRGKNVRHIFGRATTPRDLQIADRFLTTAAPMRVDRMIALWTRLIK